MEFKNSSSIVLSKFNIFFQIIVYLLIVSCIVTVISVCILIPVERGFFDKPEVKLITDDFDNTVSEFVHGKTSIINAVTDIDSQVDSLWELIKQEKSFMNRVICTLVFMYLFYKFLLSLMNVTISFIMNRFMSSCLKYGFMSAFFKTLKKAVPYALFYTLFSAPFNFALFLLFFIIISGTFGVLSLFSLTLALLVVLVLLSIRALLLSGWLPAYIQKDDNKLWVSFRDGFGVVKARWRRIFITFLPTYFIAYIIMFGLALPTFGLSLIFGYALLLLAQRAIELVFYYSNHSKNYYIDPRTIVDSREISERTEIQTADGD